MPPNSDRALRALSMRRYGFKLDNIANEFGVTRERARQLVVLGQTIEQHKESSDPWYELSARIRNALIRDGCEPTPPGVWAFTRAVSLARVPNLGVKAIAEIHTWLTKHWRGAICK